MPICSLAGLNHCIECNSRLLDTEDIPRKNLDRKHHLR